MKDDLGNEIQVGDTLRSKWDYDVIVVEDPTTHELVGKLVCEPGHSCENIPYSLSGGRDHGLVRRRAP